MFNEKGDFFLILFYFLKLDYSKPIVAISW